MLIKEIKQALIGKVLSYYDGWNGSSDYFKIGYIKGCGSCISVYSQSIHSQTHRVWRIRQAQ